MARVRRHGLQSMRAWNEVKLMGRQFFSTCFASADCTDPGGQCRITRTVYKISDQTVDYFFRRRPHERILRLTLFTQRDCRLIGFLGKDPPVVPLLALLSGFNDHLTDRLLSGGGCLCDKHVQFPSRFFPDLRNASLAN